MEIKEQLPGTVLAGLYANSLVLIDDKTGDKITDDTINISAKKHLGDYKNKIVVLVNDADNTYLNETDLNFLSGILKACKLSIEDIALINFNKNELHYSELKKELQPSYLLSFGIDVLQIQLPFTMPHYQVQQYDKCQIVTAPSLYELNQQSQQSKTEKAKLWKSLQKIFSLEK